MRLGLLKFVLKYRIIYCIYVSEMHFCLCKEKDKFQKCFPSLCTLPSITSTTQRISQHSLADLGMGFRDCNGSEKNLFQRRGSIQGAQIPTYISGFSFSNDSGNVSKWKAYLIVNDIFPYYLTIFKAKWHNSGMRLWKKKFLPGTTESTNSYL